VHFVARAVRRRFFSLQDELEALYEQHEAI